MDGLTQPSNAPYRTFLEKVVASDETHGRFLATLSLLEHIGSRKIMLTFKNNPPNREVLKHMAEEARHAFFFRTRAEALQKQPLGELANDNAVAPAAAKTYFAKLDSGIEDALIAQGLSGHKLHETCYLWVSLIIELRANWAFGHYNTVLQESQKPFSLKSILAEETLHLEEMFAAVTAIDPNAQQTLPRLCQLENELFMQFFTQLQKAVA